MDVISGLRAEAVPHREWAFRRWYQGNGRYYHGPRNGRQWVIPNREFYERVDPILRPLCRVLQESGLRTTPSCEGHFHSRERFEGVWEQMQREQAQISNGGLLVHDAETDEVTLFRDTGFRLPWNEFEQFCAEAHSEQGSGYLGVLVPRPLDDLIVALENAARTVMGISMGFDERGEELDHNMLFHISVTTDSPSSQAMAWMQITEELSIICRHACQFSAGT